MSDIDALKAEIKKLSAKATKVKMDLHDLSEELPVNWQQIPEVAQRAHDAYRDPGKEARTVEAFGNRVSRGVKERAMDSLTRDGRAWEPEYLVAIDSKTASAAGVASRFAAATS